MFLATRTAEQIAEMARLSPLDRLGDPSEIAAVISFLAGPDGAWVNGQTIRANGGAA
jgi:3-oxoacyl-[acyl-carrier protein] reductase